MFCLILDMFCSVFIISNYSFLPLKKILNEFIFGHTENVGNTSNLHIYPACALREREVFLSWAFYIFYSPVLHVQEVVTHFM